MAGQQVLPHARLILGTASSGHEHHREQPPHGARLARQKKEFDLICFTGYQYERLVKNPPNNGVTALLAEVDVLIDGPFIQSLNDSKGLRGSSNQRIIHLTSKLKAHDFESQTRTIEITITDGELAFVGIPTPEITAAMKRTNHAGTERME